MFGCKITRRQVENVQIRFTEIDLANLEQVYHDILKSRRAKKPENRARALAKANSIYRVIQIMKTERNLC